MPYNIKFTQGNNQVVNVSISNDSKKKFGSFGYMWVVSFDNGTSQFMDHKTIFERTGNRYAKRGAEFITKTIRQLLIITSLLTAIKSALILCGMSGKYRMIILGQICSYLTHSLIVANSQKRVNYYV